MLFFNLLGRRTSRRSGLVTIRRGSGLRFGWQSGVFFIGVCIGLVFLFRGGFSVAGERIGRAAGELLGASSSKAPRGGDVSVKDLPAKTVDRKGATELALPPPHPKEIPPPPGSDPATSLSAGSRVFHPKLFLSGRGGFAGQLLDEDGRLAEVFLRTAEGAWRLFVGRVLPDGWTVVSVGRDCVGFCRIGSGETYAWYR